MLKEVLGKHGCFSSHLHLPTGNGLLTELMRVYILMNILMFVFSLHAGALPRLSLAYTQCWCCSCCHIVRLLAMMLSNNLLALPRCLATATRWTASPLSRLICQKLKSKLNEKASQLITF